MQVQTLEARLSETVKAYEAKANESSMSQIALVEVEKKLSAAEEKTTIAESRLNESESKSQHERSVSSLVRLLVNALNNDPTLNECDHWLTMLYGILRERNGLSDAVPEPPVIKTSKTDTTVDEVVVCKRCEYLNELSAREALIRSEMESYLKENLQLKARVRDLESDIAGDVSPMQLPWNGSLELDSSQSLGTSPAVKKTMHDETAAAPTVRPDQSRTLDRIQDTVFIISLAPFLAIILLLLAPFHTRFIHYVKNE
ncbi:hypothetical protein KIN20_024562 [Parelaphostrongylus tenuis]|uniref:Uncharacterized protein n=1 Tax=Parelaphostrongylus tenuis TaxID=148309 RepID=A0AAD5N8B1_PARTN|nr:hypothetical protein KIN20_024562 [Parelaphostrongylus tenuis]